MGKFKINFNKFLFESKARIHAIIFLISISSLFLVFLKIIKIDVILGIPATSILGLLLFLAFLFSTIFIITFLPSYPCFFIIFNRKGFNFLEKLSLTIVVNLSFYILTGYIGFISAFQITAFYFFVSLSISYFSIIAYILIKDIRIGSYNFFKSNKFSGKSNYENFSFIKYLKKLIPSNGFLLIIFLILICVFNIVRFEYFFGTDPWLHIFISKQIVKMNYLPIEEYYGSVGLPIFGAVIHFFSGVDFIQIPKFFVCYTIPLSALVFYNILMRIFKNQNLAFFGVFILEFSGLGFAYMMYQYWPAHLVLIKTLTIFFLLYVRLQNFIQIERPTKKSVFSDMPFFYLIITILFISAILTHVLTSIILLLCFMWILLIYFIKDYRRGFDFLLLCCLFGIFILFLYFGLSAEHFYFFERMDFSSFSLAFLLATIGIGVAGVILVWRLQNSILFTTGRFTKTVRGEEFSYYKKIEDKLILPLSLSIIIIIVVFYYIGNLLVFKLPVTSIFTGIEIMIFVAFAIWGIILFQKKPRGKLMIIWAIFFGFFFVAVFIIDTLTINRKYWARIFFMTPPLVVIGFISYIYKLIKAKSMSEKRVKFFIIFLIGFSLCTTYFHEYETVPYVSLTNRQVGGAKWYSEHTSDKNVIITEFGFYYMFMYYDYPYNEKDQNIDGWDTHHFEDTKDNELFQPDEHIDGDENKLRELKEEHETDVVITLDDQYYYNKEWDTYGYVSEEDQEEYYELEYLNRIYSAKSKDGTDNAYYWVI